jgi:hypothetical protein
MRGGSGAAAPRGAGRRGGWLERRRRPTGAGEFGLPRGGACRGPRAAGAAVRPARPSPHETRLRPAGACWGRAAPTPRTPGSRRATAAQRSGGGAVGRARRSRRRRRRRAAARRRRRRRHHRRQTWRRRRARPGAGAGTGGGCREEGGGAWVVVPPGRRWWLPDWAGPAARCSRPRSPGARPKHGALQCAWGQGWGAAAAAPRTSRCPRWACVRRRRPAHHAAEPLLRAPRGATQEGAHAAYNRRRGHGQHRCRRTRGMVVKRDLGRVAQGVWASTGRRKRHKCDCKWDQATPHGRVAPRSRPVAAARRPGTRPRAQYPAVQ